MLSITLRRQQRRQRIYQYCVAHTDFASQKSLRRERVFRERSHTLDSYGEEELQRRYRFSWEGIVCFSDLGPDLERSSRRNNALPVELQVVLALQFFATGTFFPDNCEFLWYTRVDSLPNSRQGYSSSPSTFYEVHSVGIAHSCAK